MNNSIKPYIVEVEQTWVTVEIAKYEVDAMSEEDAKLKYELYGGHFIDSKEKPDENFDLVNECVVKAYKKS